MKRYSPAERAIYRRHLRMWRAIFEKGFDEIAFAAAQEYVDHQTAMRKIGEAVVSATNRVIVDIIDEYLREKIIRPLLGEAPLTQELQGFTVTFRPDGAQ
jgi:hypothetical protein